MTLSFYSFQPFLFLGFVFSIPIVSSCVRTVNSAPGDFIPIRNSAKTFILIQETTIIPTETEKTQDILPIEKKDSLNEDTVHIQKITSSNQRAVARAALILNKDDQKQKENVIDEKEKVFKEHMERYRSLFSAHANSELVKKDSIKKTEEPKKEKTTRNPVVDGSCPQCPEIMIPTMEALQSQCENLQYIENNFLLNMDVEVPEIKESRSLDNCTKIIICKEPYAIVRWFDYTMCDIHNSSKDDPVFVVSCNGTHWTMQGFPVDAVTCAKRKG